MPQPIPFQRRLAPHLVAPPRPARETDEQRRDRQLAITRELADLNMVAARDAAYRIETRDPDQPDPAPASADPTLALARATRAVSTVIGLENRIAAGEQARPFAVDDPRAVALRGLLHPLAATEPDPVRRRALRNSMNDLIDEALGSDLDDNLPLASIAEIIAQRHGLKLDITKLADEFLEAPYLPGPRMRPEAQARDQR